MKKILLLIIFASPIFVIGQTKKNIISNQIYNAIEVDGVRLDFLKDFQGEAAELSQLFNLTFSLDSPDPEAKTFNNPLISLVYGGSLPRQLYYFEIKGSNIEMLMNGIGYHLGDYFMTSNFMTFTDENGKHCAAFRPLYESSYITIEYDANNIITKIFFIAPI